MKSVLISIRPSWCGRIACGEKTIELRKTKPKQAAPFKCYIYCTSRINGPLSVFWNGDIIGNGKVIGEFLCDRIEEFESEFYSSDNVLNAIYRVVEDEDYPGERIYTSIATNEEDSENFWICSLSCLSFEEIKKYIGYAKRETAFYGWHISDVVIYDQPKELNSFYCRKLLTRPPQSWCYVEEVGE